MTTRGTSDVPEEQALATLFSCPRKLGLDFKFMNIIRECSPICNGQ
ncbi:hypothetical protein F441_08747 [Phytophthora nicotianae CJ01A1]|uniref:Uncharacterized protein n=5 Tax=Phytophthora nicotianae TaxID=4792 RepID=V9DTN6_PHYNI|nr:hypothetical protein F443_23188 [Phytophthora nicotianae P1569]ETK86841.1 hypothetical protein L915_08600 [Phytophthora nicotianae]ETO75613.1 hypothetical protein F444_08832 [Phytophthora nicotianae P1976]ETP16696.1 hypothetical protein F441_08747 [Phytophthora nicotianae CJ01A1]ETP44760.1 hypothetical protein F442_08704 [Phytophthora nicotianae P10297]